MNKTFCKKSNFINFMFAGCLILFNVSCGLDVFYDIAAPYCNGELYYDNIDESEKYFLFTTAEPKNKEDSNYIGITFLGTEVYYKIYNSTSKLNSDVSSINSYISNSTSANLSVDRLTSITYNYQPLRSFNDTGANILIENKYSNRKIKIRLSSYHDEYLAGIDRLNDNGEVIESFGIPVRNLPNGNPNFNFREQKGTDLLPVGGDNADPDYAYTNTTEEIKQYYVALFAVAKGIDQNKIPQYSPATYLGSVTISLE